MAEEEQFFVYVGVTQSTKIGKLPTIIVYNTKIAGISTTRLFKSTSVFRIPVDFDPLNIHMYFVVGIKYNLDLGGLTNEDMYQAVAVFNDKLAAQEYSEFLKLNWTKFISQDKASIQLKSVVIDEYLAPLI